MELAASRRIQFGEMPSRAGVYFRPGNVGGLRLAFGSTGGDEDSLRGVTLECKPFSDFSFIQFTLSAPRALHFVPGYRLILLLSFISAGDGVLMLSHLDSG